MSKFILFLFVCIFSTNALANNWDVNISFSPYLDYREVRYSVELDEPVSTDDYADILVAGPCQKAAGFDGGGLTCGWPPNGERACKTMSSTCRYLLRESDDPEAYYEYFTYLDTYELYGAMPTYEEYPFTNLLFGLYGKRVNGDEVENLPAFFCQKFRIDGIEHMNSLIINSLIPIIETGNSDQIMEQLPNFCDVGDYEILERMLGKGTQIWMKVGMRYSRGTQMFGTLNRIE